MSVTVTIDGASLGCEELKACQFITTLSGDSVAYGNVQLDKLMQYIRETRDAMATLSEDLKSCEQNCCRNGGND